MSLDSLPKIIRKIPRDCLEQSPARAWLTLARDAALTAALVTLIVRADSWAVAPVLSVLLGCVLTGLFVIGHDAGHRSFSRSTRVNDAVGTLTMAPLLWPFHVWRLSHDHHHRWTHHAAKEIAWKPLTLAEYDALPPWKRRIYMLTRTHLFFLASTLFQYFYVEDAAKGRFFDPKDHALLKRSIRITIATGLGYVGVVSALWGAYGFVWLFLVPQLVFHFWLSTFTLFHHTSVDNALMPEGEWTAEKAQLACSVHVKYPRLVDWLTHDIAWHVPHHVCVGIPHYRLRAAHRALKAAYPDVVVERSLSPALLKEVLGQCHLIASAEQSAWLTATEVVTSASHTSRPA